MIFTKKLIYCNLKKNFKTMSKAKFLDDLEKFCQSSKAKGEDNLPKEICEILNKVFTDQHSASVKNPIEGDVWKNKGISSFP